MQNINSDLKHHSLLYIFLSGNMTNASMNIGLEALDVIIVMSMLTAWLISLALFLNKWSKIRISKSPGSLIKPKNLDSIQVRKLSLEYVSPCRCVCMCVVDSMGQFSTVVARWTLGLQVTGRAVNNARGA